MRYATFHPPRAVNCAARWCVWIPFGMCLLLTVLSVSAGRAEEEQDPNQPKVVKLTLHPAAPVSPALKHRLYPGRFERQPGNAVPFYYRALLVYQQNQGRQEMEQEHAEAYQRWEQRPCEGQTRQEIKKWLDRFPKGSVDQLREAVYREKCDFDFRLGDRGGIELISLLLPEIQEMRTLGRYLRLKACVEISEQRYDDAIESLRMGYQMGRDTASEPLLINGLVGVAIASMMNSEVEGWIGSPDSPNLYWAIAAIPQPLVDLRPALEQESRLPEMVFPFLKDADKVQRPAEEWQRILSESVGQLHVITGNPQDQNPFNKFTAGLASTAIVMRAYPVAKQELEKSGYGVETLEKMPTGQVVAIYMQQVVRYIGDEMEKGAYLSPKQREEYYATLDQRLIRDGYLGPGGGTKEPIPIASLLMPAVSRALSAQSRLERDFAALQTLEAIRAHLAATGDFPDKLADITALPVPANPLTDQPFEYRREGVKAILVVPSVSKRDPANTGKRYELQKAK